MEKFNRTEGRKRNIFVFLLSDRCLLIISSPSENTIFFSLKPSFDVYFVVDFIFIVFFSLFLVLKYKRISRILSVVIRIDLFKQSSELENREREKKEFFVVSFNHFSMSFRFYPIKFAKEVINQRQTLLDFVQSIKPNRTRCINKFLA